MLCILWLAASLAGLYDGRVASFVLSYVALKLLLSGLYVRASRYAANVRAFAGRVAAGNFAGVAIWLSSLLVPTPERYGIWPLALFVELLTPILAVRAAYGGAAYMPRVFHPEHFAERYGMFTIIVLGESVLAVAVGTAGTGWEPAALILLVAPGSALAPILFAWLVVLAMLGLTAFETLYAGRSAPG